MRTQKHCDTITAQKLNHKIKKKKRKKIQRNRQPSGARSFTFVSNLKDNDVNKNVD